MKCTFWGCDIPSYSDTFQILAGISDNRTTIIRLWKESVPMNFLEYGCLYKIIIMQISIDLSVGTGGISHSPPQTSKWRITGSQWLLTKRESIPCRTNYCRVVQSRVVNLNTSIWEQSSGNFVGYAVGGGTRRGEWEWCKYCDHIWNSKKNPIHLITFLFRHYAK